MVDYEEVANRNRESASFNPAKFFFIFPKSKMKVNRFIRLNVKCKRLIIYSRVISGVLFAAENQK